MDADRDLSASLPDPPPPRPDRRDAAIAEALRRFDGAPPEVPPAPRPARRPAHRPQIAAVATVALVAMVSVPIWLNNRHWFGAAHPDAPVAAEKAIPPAPVARAAGATPLPTASEPPLSDRSVAPTRSLEAPPALAEPPQPEARFTAPADAPAPAPAPPPPPPPTAEKATSEGYLNTLPQAPRAAPQDERRSEALVVTGVRARREYRDAAPVAKADASPVTASAPWNLCTIDDPRRDVRNCFALADPAGPGASGRAAAQFVDGMTRAWAGDLDGAIAAFDRAIDQAPLAIAYLNRGLAWERKGDATRALADLDRAVRRAPDSALGYYHRSLHYRAQGGADRAEADAHRAIELDPSYANAPR